MAGTLDLEVNDVGGRGGSGIEAYMLILGGGGGAFVFLGRHTGDEVEIPCGGQEGSGRVGAMEEVGDMGIWRYDRIGVRSGSESKDRWEEDDFEVVEDNEGVVPCPWLTLYGW